MQRQVSQSANNYKYPVAQAELHRNFKYTQIFEKVFQNRQKLHHHYLDGMQDLLSQIKQEKQVEPKNCCEYLLHYLVDSVDNEVNTFKKFIFSVQKQVLPIFTTKIQEFSTFYSNKASKLQKALDQIAFQQIQTKSALDKYMISYQQLKSLQENFIISKITTKKFEESDKKRRLVDDKYKKTETIKKKYQIKTEQIRQNIIRYKKENEELCQVLSVKEKGLKQIFRNSLKKYEEFYNQFITMVGNSNKDRDRQLQSQLKKYQAQKQTEKPNIKQLSVPTGPTLYYVQTLFNYQSQKQFNPLHNLLNFEKNKKEISKISRESFSTSTPISSSISESSSISNYSAIFEDLKFSDLDCNEQTVKVISHHIQTIFIVQGVEDNQQLIGLIQLIRGSYYKKKMALFCMEVILKGQDFYIPFCNIKNIKLFLNEFLSQCIQQRDIHNSKHLLWLLVSKSVQQQDGNEVILAKFVKNHEIWHSFQYWECVFLQNCYQYFIITPKNKIKQTKITIEMIKGLSNNNNLISNQQMFNFLQSFAYQMEALQLPNSKIEKFVTKYIKLLKLKQIFSNPDSILRNYVNMQHASLNNQRSWLGSFLH